MQTRPRNFQITEAARARIISAVQDFFRADRFTPWIAGIVWVTHGGPDGDVVREGPSIVPYDQCNVPAGMACDIDGIPVVFLRPDDSRFENKTMNFRADRDFYLE
jgi:hypothetical protein